METIDSGSPIFYKLRTQASFFLKEKIKAARLTFTDVTPTELLAEEVTDGNTWPPDKRIMKVVSRAAFEVEDYWRIMEILHQRLLKFDRDEWRTSYNSLVLLEHLLTHGPKRVSEEFQDDKNVIEEIGRFQYIDEKGFNWGLSVMKLSERVLRLLGNEMLLKEERARARKLTRKIKGFGSLSQLQRSYSSKDGNSLTDSSFKSHRRCNSQNFDFSDFLNQDNEFMDLKESFSTKDSEMPETNTPTYFLLGAEDEDVVEENHPFYNGELQTTTSLLNDSLAIGN